jgi:hypothetical protein
MTNRGPSESWIGAACIALAVAFCACELTDERTVEQEPEILAVAVVCNAELARDFDCEPLDLSGIEMTWSPDGSSAPFWSRRIWIDVECRGTTRVKYPVKHEIFHLMSERDDSASCWRGRRIADYVPAWTGREECGE